ncbi:MAG: DnaJ domain-containing protein [Candidatus Micrarchaeota archaeon]|nr:DnaJ domain-containing protein [Candidatus Micrarchaeota archaeon]
MMGIIDGIRGHISRTRRNMRMSAAKRISRDSERMSKQMDGVFESFNVKPARPANTEDHYKTLGIGYTKDPSAIRKAYIDSIKRSHPDVSKSKSAEEDAKRINRAYQVLKDMQSKLDYDTLLLAKGAKMEQAEEARLLGALVSAYSSARKAAYGEMVERAKRATSYAAFASEIEAYLKWEQTFNGVSRRLFGKGKGIAAKAKKLSSKNMQMSKKEKDEEIRSVLEKNEASLHALEAMSGSFSANADLVMKRARALIEPSEKEAARELRRNL